MSYKPDYGLALLNSGTSREVIQKFYDFHLFSLTVLGRCQYSTMVEMPFDGELYALSLDFNQKQLDKILLKTESNTSAFLRNELSKDPATPRTINFDVEVIFGVAAKLGELQRVQNESFVPFIAQEIM